MVGGTGIGSNVKLSCWSVVVVVVCGAVHVVSEQVLGEKLKRA
jgi:hypothetical protein